MNDPAYVFQGMWAVYSKFPSGRISSGSTHDSVRPKSKNEVVVIKQANFPVYRRAHVTWYWLALLAMVLVYGFSLKRPPPIEALDPAMLKAVTETLSPADVSAILSRQRSTSPVNLQLYSLCDQEQRCKIFTTMIFPGTSGRASTMSLHVTTHVDGLCCGHFRLLHAHQHIRSSWSIRLSEPGAGANVVEYAGELSDLDSLSAIDEDNAIAHVFVSIHNAVGKVLAEPHSPILPST